MVARCSWHCSRTACVTERYFHADFSLRLKEWFGRERRKRNGSQGWDSAT